MAVVRWLADRIGVISSVNFTLRGMTAFDLLVILILAFGGLGLFIRSLGEIRNSNEPAR